MSRRDWTLFVTKIQEASNGIPAENKLLQPDVDCAAIKGLRNRIVHEYFGLSLAVIWAIVQTDLPVLAQQLSNWLDTP
jgi:uncharacterized protein with HEPN domain